MDEKTSQYQHELNQQIFDNPFADLAYRPPSHVQTRFITSHTPHQINYETHSTPYFVMTLSISLCHSHSTQFRDNYTTSNVTATATTTTCTTNTNFASTTTITITKLKELPALQQGRSLPRERGHVSTEIRQGLSCPKVLCVFDQSGRCSSETRTLERSPLRPRGRGHGKHLVFCSATNPREAQGKP